MGEKLRRAAAWIGIVPDDRYEDYQEYDQDEEFTEGVYPDDDEPEALEERRDGRGTVTSLEPRRGGRDPQRRPQAPVAVQPMTAAEALARIITVHPRTYNEARTIGEHFRDGVPVIMNLSEMEDADAKRLVDFAAGLIFGLHGNIERVTSKVFLLSPANVNVTAEDKERIAGGFFNQS
ncbi:cell division protein SepF [Parenemella sanctibonifatiensis]|uniref:Cell division protein SepF n=1 Tax=Parenemella sanctibonifatiensis TaxID=2016505 RepID=A0A255E9T1_9ACTN|nr:cell division protein SepF [Parenemella sanctibonifatiensis]OYN88327.1 cell division protein SepF [Parenemella sanctibonifatiensis]